MLAEVGVTAEQLPEIVVGTEPGGRVGGDDGPLLGGGTIDAMAEQVVAGADNDGDVLVICGTTLITWAVMRGEEWLEQPGLWTIPHTAPGKLIIGGPSNAGGLFLNWARQLAGAGDGEVAPVDDPSNVPVWLPYVRGERTPLHRHDLRASLHGLNLTHTPAHVVQAAYEAAGFVVRHHLDLAGRLDRAAAHRRHRRRRASSRGCRRWPTAPDCPSTSSRCPRAARSAPRSSRVASPGSRRRWATARAGRASRRRVEPDVEVGRRRRRPLRAVQD